VIAVHILSYHDGEVYLHHGMLIIFVLLFVASAASPSLYGVKDMLKDIRDELRKRNS
jgi:hypothetical protein